MVRCKACGYIMSASKLGDMCPACGAPRTAFEPYVDPMAASRRKILNIHLHSMAVHFPVSFSVAAFVFSLATVFLSGDARALLVNATKVIVLLLPALVVIAFVVGWIDGTVRFRKIRKSPILKRKILYAVFLFVLSVSLALVAWTGGSSGFVLPLVILLAAGTVVLIVLLGLLGTSILGAAFPGK